MQQIKNAGIKNPTNYIHRQISRIPNKQHSDVHKNGLNKQWKTWFKQNPNFTKLDLQRNIKNMMKANLEFQKALLLLDFGKLAEGLEKLKHVIVKAENENDKVTLVQSLVCIGDLCIELELFQDAIFYLNRALSYHHDVLKCEMYRANELLNVASKNLHYN